LSVVITGAGASAESLVAEKKAKIVRAIPKTTLRSFLNFMSYHTIGFVKHIFSNPDYTFCVIWVTIAAVDSYDDQEVAQFFSAHKLVRFKNKETLIKEEDNPSGVFYLKKGLVRMDAVFENGTEITFNIFKPGAIFPAFWAIAGVNNSFNYTAMNELEVYRAPREEFLRYLDGHPKTLLKLTQRILVGIDGLLAGIKNLFCGSAYKKIATIIYILWKRFGEGNKIGIKLTHQDLARLAGVARETASIELKKLEREKIITMDKGFLEITDFKALDIICELAGI